MQYKFFYFICLFILIGCGNIYEENCETSRKRMYLRAKRKADSLLISSSQKDILRVIGFKEEKNRNFNWVGSAFVIEYKDKQYLISATHVISESSKIQLYKKDKLQKFSIQRKFYFDDAMIAELQEKTFENPYEIDIGFLNSIQSYIDRNEMILCTAYGYTTDGLKKTEGHILALYTNENNLTLFVSSNPIVSGMSGGVLVNNEGKAIGVISAFIHGPDHFGMYFTLSNLIKIIEDAED